MDGEEEQRAAAAAAAAAAEAAAAAGGEEAAEVAGGGEGEGPGPGGGGGEGEERSGDGGGEGADAEALAAEVVAGVGVVPAAPGTPGENEPAAVTTADGPGQDMEEAFGTAAELAGAGALGGVGGGAPEDHASHDADAAQPGEKDDAAAGPGAAPPAQVLDGEESPTPESGGTGEPPSPEIEDGAAPPSAGTSNGALDPSDGGETGAGGTIDSPDDVMMQGPFAEDQGASRGAQPTDERCSAEVPEEKPTLALLAPESPAEAEVPMGIAANELAAPEFMAPASAVKKEVPMDIATNELAAPEFTAPASAVKKEVPMDIATNELAAPEFTAPASAVKEEFPAPEQPKASGPSPFAVEAAAQPQPEAASKLSAAAGAPVKSAPPGDASSWKTADSGGHAQALAEREPVAALIEKLRAAVPDTPSADKLARICNRIANPVSPDYDPYDTDAWNALMSETFSHTDAALAREMFELFLKQFPTSARHWIQYAEYELRLEELEKVEAIFARCLRSVLSVDLWRFYLAYIRRINTDDKGKPRTLAARGVISKAYEFVLQYVGLDRDSGPIWADYLYFQKLADVNGTWEEQQKMDAMRKAYHRAVSTPLANVEHLWREYDAFENSLNRVTAKKFLADKSPAYMTARAAVREIRSVTEGISRSALARPPKWTSKEVNQLEQWKRYIAWEKSNPLQLDEDSPALAARIIYAYKQALLVLRFYPEMWYDAADYWLHLGKVDDAANLLKMGTEVMSTSFLLTLTYTELEEGRKQHDRARAAYRALVSAVTAEHAKTKARLEAVVRAMEEEHWQDMEREKAKMTSASPAPAAPAEDLDDDDAVIRAGAAAARLTEEEVRERLRQRQTEFESRLEEVSKRNAGILKSASQAISLAWIMFIRFARRVDGIKAAREVFLKARKSPGTGWQVFVASALMEYYNSKDPAVAGRVFELGLKTFGQEPSYVVQYLEHLIHLNDDGNTRALFERTLQTLTPQNAQPIWKLFSDYENKYGDMAAMQRIEKRRAEAEPDVPAIRRRVERFTYLDINVVQKEVSSATPKLRQKEAKQREQAGAATETAGAPAKAGREESHHRGRGPVLLDSVHPERFPRPDFGKWVPYKPNPGPRPPPMAGGPGAGGPPAGERPGLDARPPRKEGPGGNPLGPGPSAVPAAAKAPAPVPPWGKLSEAIGYFLSQIPPPAMFGASVVNPDDVLSILQSVAIRSPHRTAMPDVDRRPLVASRASPPARDRSYERRGPSHRDDRMAAVPPPGTVPLPRGSPPAAGPLDMSQATPPLMIHQRQQVHYGDMAPPPPQIPVQRSGPPRRGFSPQPMIRRGAPVASPPPLPPPGGRESRRTSTGQPPAYQTASPHMHLHQQYQGTSSHPPPQQPRRSEWAGAPLIGAAGGGPDPRVMPSPGPPMGVAMKRKLGPTYTGPEDPSIATAMAMGIHGSMPSTLRGPPVEDPMYWRRPVKRYRDDGM